MHPRPEPREGNLLGGVAEFGAKKGTPDCLICLVANPVADPRGSTAVLEDTAVGHRLQNTEAERHVETAERREWAEPKERERGVELAVRTVAEGGRDRSMPHKTIRQPHFVDQRHGSAIGLEQVVVELLEPHARLYFEAGG